VSGTYSNHELGSLELPEGNIDGDTTLTLGLQLVQDPGYSQPRISTTDIRKVQD